MTRISNADQALQILRQQLQRMSGKSEAKRSNKTDATRPSQQKAITRLKALAQLEELSSEEFERTLVQGLLIDEFGEGVVNDPHFQKLVDNVLAIISSDQKSRQLLLSAKRELLD